MEEKEPIKVRFSTVILCFIILVLIGALVYFVMDSRNAKGSTTIIQQGQGQTKSNVEKVEDVQTTVGSGTNQDKFLEYKENYSKSFANTITGNNTISVYLGEERKDELPGIVEVYVDANGKAYVAMKNGNKKQVETDVANVYVCPIGNGGYSDIVFVKNDGTVSTISGSDVENGTIKSTVKTNAKNVINVISYSELDSTGAGGHTYAFVDIDGNITKMNATSSSSEVSSASQETSTSTTESTNSKYIEMTEANYKKYNTLPYSFRIQEMIDNNGTITIRGRVYEKIELLSLTKEQYQELVKGNTINLLGYQMKANKEEDPNNGGYDMLITSTGSKWMKFYVEKNSDGTGKLHYYTEQEGYAGTPFQEGENGRYIGTDTYMEITLDENLKCKFGDENITLKKEYNSRKTKGTLSINEKDDTKFPLSNDEFVFKNGKCTSIIFSNI